MGIPPRVGKKTGKWNPTMEPVHNEGLAPTNQQIQKYDYIRWLTNTNIRQAVRDEIRDIFHDPGRDFDSNAFRQRVTISSRCVAKIYYRKISNGELQAIQNQQVPENQRKPFNIAFAYTNTANYRYWISSSLAKVQAFGNANSTDAGGIIIKLTFSEDLRVSTTYSVKAHQEPGVQHDTAAIALHREGFAEIGLINNALQVTDIINNNLDHNLGFTAHHKDYLNQKCTKWEVVT
jgi:hypothetical protein